LLTLAVDRDHFRAERINLEPLDLARLQDFVVFVRELKSTSGASLDRAVERLGRVLLPIPLRDFIAAKPRVIFSPHRSLHLFPFHALRWTETDFIATRFAVRYVPNFSSLLLPVQPAPANRILALGIGEFTDPKITPLPLVEPNVRAIQQFYVDQGADVETLLGAQATRSGMEELRDRGELAKFRCIHFGTHGLSVFDTPNQPLEARLLLQDGALDAMAITGLHLNADLVVLSACHSGQRALAVRDSKELPGDDIFGLQSALFESGARSVLGTLWLVETTSSSTLIRAFHRHYAASQSAEYALQNAIRDYLAAPGNARGIFYWAPYFVSCLGSPSIRPSTS
jgi:CHAT domain-containing protein